MSAAAVKSCAILTLREMRDPRHSPMVGDRFEDCDGVCALVVNVDGTKVFVDIGGVMAVIRRAHFANFVFIGTT